MAAPATQPSWLEAYHSTILRGGDGPKKPAGPHCCAVCCTFFAAFGALFLLVIAGLMNSGYPYMHIQGEMTSLSRSVTLAGIFYLVIALISAIMWVRGAYRAGQLSRTTQFSELRT